MKTSIVLLVSEQNIPNLLFIKELGVGADAFYFITTSLMQAQGKADQLLEAAALPRERCFVKELRDENNYQAVHSQLEQWFPADDSFLVNLTGGTKMMFLVAYNFFHNIRNKVYYMPIGQNLIVQMGEKDSAIPVDYRLSVREYLIAHGISYEALAEHEIADKEVLKRVLKEYKKNGFDHEVVTAQRSNEHKMFFGGTWFEHWVYHKIKEQYKLDASGIETGLKINNLPQMHRMGNDNELDVVFTFNNELHVLEAKVSIGKMKVNKQSLDNIMFKLSALNKNFGLRSYPWIVTLADLNLAGEVFKQDLNRKLKVLGISGIEDRSKVLANERLCGR